MSRRARAYKNVLSLQLSRILNKVFQVFFMAMAARYLGRGGFGQWSLVLLLIGFFGLIADFGVDRLTVRDVARDLGSSSKYLSNTFVFKLLSLIPATLLFLGVVFFADYPEELVELFLIALPMFFFGVLASPFSSLIQAHEKIYLLSMADIALGFLTSISGISLLYFGFGIRGLLVLNIVSSMARFIVLFFVTKRLIHRMWYPIQLSFLGKLVKGAFPFAVLNILALIHWKVDYFMISKLLGEEQLGLYAAAYKIFENIVYLGMAFNAALYPSVSALFSESREKLRRIYEGFQKYFIIISFPISILIYFFASEIILVLYGSQYLESVGVLIIFCFGFSFFFFSLPMRLIINNSELIMKVVPYATMTTCLNVILNLLMIPRYGIIGAASVSLFVGAIDVLIRVHFIRKIFRKGYHPLNLIWKPMAAALIMVVIIFVFSGVSRYVFAVVGLGAYFYSLFVMGALNRDEYNRFFKDPMVKLISSITRR